MNKQELYLFCGGPSGDESGLPKPLSKINNDKSLLYYYLRYIENFYEQLPGSITLLCDDGQEKPFQDEVDQLNYAVPIVSRSCGKNASTFEKFDYAIESIASENKILRFGYPDIFFFGDYIEPDFGMVENNEEVFISAATLTSRFPRLVIDEYRSKVKGISDYRSPIPANPMHVFGGDLWGSQKKLAELNTEFKMRHKEGNKPSLEYDFFFWLINNQKMNCIMLYGERIWVDSARDIRNLLSHLDY